MLRLSGFQLMPVAIWFAVTAWGFLSSQAPMTSSATSSTARYLLGQRGLGALQVVGEVGGLVARADPVEGLGPHLLAVLVEVDSRFGRVPIQTRHRQKPPIPARVVRQAPRVVRRADDHAAPRQGVGRGRSGFYIAAGKSR